jgi:S-DNA-T family DNA segregation ATPase FtsK/SpoIIIE
MFKYIKGFYKLITGDGSPKKVDRQSQGEKNSLNKPKLQQEDKNMSTRISYQYPKGNFRFPLISDDDVKKQLDRRPKQRKMEVPKTVTPIKKTPSKNKNKGSFKATIVPSPIHGYNPLKEQEEPIVEFELPSAFEEEKVQPVNPNVLLTYSVLSDQEAETLEAEFSEENPEWFDTKKDSYIDNNDSDVLDAEKKDNITIEEVAIHNDSDSIIATEEPEPLHSVENVQTDRSTKEVVSAVPRRYVPFNVVMLKQDRAKLREKQNISQDRQDVIEEVENNLVQQHMETTETVVSTYQFPPLHYLTMPKHDVNVDDQWLLEQQELLDVTLHNFNVKAKVVNVTQGPSVTRFEVHPEPGVKVNKITNLSDDIKLALSAKDIRMEAPIPGKNTIGIEVPNKQSKPVLLSEIISTQAFRGNPSPLTVALGLDISGKPIITDLKKMPHGLIAGATGSGKSVCINAMLISLLYKATPSEVKLLLIDPKMVELAPYNDIPHLVSPVITDVKAATAALKWAVEEMERRYERFAHTGVRDISRYNELVREHNEPSGEMPFLVIVIDELADLMMVAPGEVEESICRIAQKARACGIHLLLATQRPSVDVITGLIKANIPTRIAFSVSSQVDSRTIIDSSGAEKLLGKGDMLFLENGSSKPFRLQGNFVSDQEIEKAVSFAKSQQKPEYLFEQQELLSKANTFVQEEDELFLEACEFVIDQGGASSSSLQRRFRIGYNRAARLIEMMEEQGFISEQKGSKPRDVLITEDQLVEKQQNN